MSWHHQNHVMYLVNHVKPSTDHLNDKYDKPYLLRLLDNSKQKTGYKIIKKNNLKQVTSKLCKPYPLTDFGVSNSPREGSS